MNKVSPYLELSKLYELRKLVDHSLEGSRELDCEIISTLISVNDYDAKLFYGAGGVLTESMDRTIALVERMLPGWWWSFGSCSVSFDGTIGPDKAFDDAELLEIKLFDDAFRVDRPDGNVCLSLISCMLAGLIAKMEHLNGSANH